MQNNQEYSAFINHSFYNFGGIKTTFKEIKSFLTEPNFKNELNKKQDENIQMVFEYIDSPAKLTLPIFYKTLIETTSTDKIENYTNLIFENYSKENKKLKKLLNQIKLMQDIPIELLSKYYIRAYTIESNFYKNINKDLGSNKKESHLSFIKVLYEGTKLKSLPLGSNNVLYRGAKISNEEIIKIKEYQNKKIENLPASIVFSKSFLSFSKEREIAEKYLKLKNNDNNLSKVLYILEKDDNLDYSLASHSDIEKISFFPNEREVLFYPFSSFEIKDIKEVNLNGENIYEINLLYLGKYLKEIEKNKDLIEKENIIPDSEYKKQMIDFGLIKPEKLKNNNTKILFNQYKKFKNDIKNENKISNLQKSMNNFIKGEFNINDNDINKEIRIINSYDDFVKHNNDNWFIKDKQKNNEKKIMENIEILINDKKIDFSYHYKFDKKGKYIIKYIFKCQLTNIAYMYKDCEYLTNIDLSNFKVRYVTNMSEMFYGCSSLRNIDLSNFNTRNVTDMSSIFNGCSSLRNIDLSNFNTQNTINMSCMFYKCSSLTNINLSNFNTQNVTNMSGMFCGCSSLININLSNFNSENVTNMSYMFKGCKSLINLDLSNFNTQSVTNMSFMFYKCYSLTNINLSNFNTQNVTNISYIFDECKSLTNIITKDELLLR